MSKKRNRSRRRRRRARRPEEMAPSAVATPAASQNIPAHETARAGRQQALLQMQQQQGNEVVTRFIRGDATEGSPLFRRGDDKKVPAPPQEESKPKAKEKTEEEKLAEILTKVDEMIQTARQIKGGEYAAENLAYWKSKQGGTKTMPAAAFADRDFILEWLRETPREKFVQGAEKRLRSGELRAGRTVDMYWEDSLNAPEGDPLYYALGGFTIRSDVTVRAEKFPGVNDADRLVTFVKWECRAFDAYNWDKMKSTVIPLFGEISDDDLLLLEKHGYGLSFDIVSEPWTITDKECLQEFAADLP